MAKSHTIHASVNDGRGTATIYTKDRRGNTVEILGTVVGVHTEAEALEVWRVEEDDSFAPKAGSWKKKANPVDPHNLRWSTHRRTPANH